MAEQLALKLQGLTKSYGKVRALRGVDLEVQRGEIFGYLGPNGAGKTTTVRIYPTEFTAFLGDMSTFATPEGFVSLEFFSYMPLILGIFGVLMGSGLLASDEEQGMLDLIIAHPVSRTALFVGRLLAFVVATIATLAIAWLGLVLPMNWSSMDIGWGRIWLPLLSLLLGAAVVFTALAWWRFQRRGIRVGGEGGWRLPGLSRLLPRRRGESKSQRS